MYVSNKKLVKFIKRLVDVYGIQSLEELFLYIEGIDFEKLEILYPLIVGGESDVSGSSEAKQ